MDTNTPKPALLGGGHRTLTNGPPYDIFKRDTVRTGYIFILALADRLCDLLVLNQNIVFIVQVKAADVHIRGPHENDLPVNGQGFGVQRKRCSVGA